MSQRTTPVSTAPVKRLAAPRRSTARVRWSAAPGDRSGSVRRALTVALLLAMVSAFLISCLSEEEPAPISVTEVWENARLSPGHQAHLEQGLECSQCHNLEGPTLGVPAEQLCAKCHEDQKLHHGAIDPPGDCLSCHQFKAGSGHPSEVPGAAGASAGMDFHDPNACLDCHAEAQHKFPAVEIHKDEPCLNCHKPHGEEGLTPRVCTECHQEVHLNHGARSSAERPIHKQCLDCHQPHSKTEPPGMACLRCHQDPTSGEGAPQIPRQALFEGGHEACNGCHKSHDLRASASSSCSDCHEGHDALSSSRVTAHQACASCHTPHDVKRSAHNACASCHQTLKNDHPKTSGAHGACTTCHDPHPKGGGRAALTVADCKTCHQEPARDHGHGGQDCASCHKPHEFKGSASSEQLCATCHKENALQTQSNTGHQDCGSCHKSLPHHPETGGIACESCHKEQAPALIKHEECLSCHRPHDGKIQKDCSSCHKGQHTSAPSGHKACTSCHNPHNKNPKAPVATCASCHKEHAKNNPHNALAQQCQTCHQPHAPSPGHASASLGPSKPPACTSCHQPKGPTLHDEAGHKQCSTCHQPHEKGAQRDRASCTSCHKEQKDHQPGAENCASCHLFRPAKK